MSDEEQGTSSTETSTRMLTAEYKDGQLEIVEVTPYDKDDKLENIEGHIISDESDSQGEVKYMQVLDGKNVVVDLLNLTLVSFDDVSNALQQSWFRERLRCEDGQEAYRLVGEDGDDATVTCVLSNDDGDDQDSQENQESYVVFEGEEGDPVVFLQSDLQQEHRTKPEVKEKKPPLTPAEILEKAKALQKAKVLSSLTTPGQRGRKRRGALPPPHELLASPQFKLFLYSCKLCPFKCNAIKELTAHKAAEHGGGAPRWRGAGRAAVTLQCARCPYRGASHNQLMKHVKEKHMDTLSSTKVFLDSDEVATADVLVCGACGFEAREREAFRAHVLSDHTS